MQCSQKYYFTKYLDKFTCFDNAITVNKSVNFKNIDVKLISAIGVYLCRDDIRFICGPDMQVKHFCRL